MERQYKKQDTNNKRENGSTKNMKQNHVTAPHDIALLQQTYGNRALARTFSSEDLGSANVIQRVKSIPYKSHYTRNKKEATHDVIPILRNFKNQHLTVEDNNDEQISSIMQSIFTDLTGQTLRDIDMDSDDSKVLGIMSLYRQVKNPSDSDVSLKVLRYALTGETYVRGHIVGGLGNLEYSGTGGLTGRPDFDLKTQSEFRDRAATYHIRHITAWHNLREFLNSVNDYFQENTDFRKEINTLLNKINDLEKEATNSEKGIGDRFNKNYENKTSTEADESPSAIIMKTAFYMNSAIKNLWAGSGKENVSRNTFAGFLNEKIAQIKNGVSLENVYYSIGNYNATLTSIKSIKETLIGNLDSLDNEDANLTTKFISCIEETYREIEIDYDKGLFASPSKNSGIHQLIMGIVRDSDQKPSGSNTYEIIKNFIL